MATKVYGQNQLPGDVVTVRQGSTISISLGFDSTVGFIGNMDTANGTATPGSVVNVADTVEAEDKFGTDSELHRSIELAYLNGVGDVYAVGVSETNTTESFGTSTSNVSTGTLSNVPVIDPQVAREHSITVTETQSGVDWSIIYKYGEPPSTPAETETIALNTVTGEWTASSSGVFDFTYDYGDYSTPIPKLLDKNLRYACLLSESEGLVNDMLTEVNSHAQQFDFMRMVAGGMPETMPANYSDAIDDQRAVIVEPARAFTDSTQSEMVRTTAAVVGHLASRPLSESSTGEVHGQIDGLVELNTKYTNGEAADFIDKQVMPVIRGTNIHIPRDVTTSSTQKFSRVYAVEIVDEVALTHHLIAEQFIGSFNFPERRQELKTSLEVPLEDFATDNPPLLEAYAVNVSEGDSDFEVDAEVGIDVTGIMDRINVNISVGDVISAPQVS